VRHSITQRYATFPRSLAEIAPLGLVVVDAEPPPDQRPLFVRGVVTLFRSRRRHPATATHIA